MGNFKASKHLKSKVLKPSSVVRIEPAKKSPHFPSFYHKIGVIRKERRSRKGKKSVGGTNGGSLGAPNLASFSRQSSHTLLEIIQRRKTTKVPSDSFGNFGHTKPGKSWPTTPPPPKAEEAKACHCRKEIIRADKSTISFLFFCVKKGDF